MVRILPLHLLIVFGNSISTCSLTSHRMDKCTSYGQCGKNMHGNQRNCYYDGPPVKLNQTKQYDDLKEICPHFFIGTEAGTVCCDENQIKTLKRSVDLPKLVTGRCPSCYRNLRSLMCAMSCAPDQASHELITETEPYIDGDGTLKIAVLDSVIALSANLLQGIIDSCRDVMFLGETVLVPICQSRNCTVDQLAKALTDITIGAPHIITPFVSNGGDVVVNDTVTLSPIDAKVFGCSEPVIGFNEYESACTCADCPKSCPEFSLNEPTVEMIGSITVTAFLVISMTLTVMVSLVATIAHNVWKDETSHKGIEGKDINDPYSTTREKAAQALEELFSKLFFRLGMICCSYPKSTISISLLCCAVLSLGLMKFQPTTDPIALWGVEDGRCIKEKQYFDKHFGPFYRLLQVFMVPKDQSEVIHDGKRYGPIFRQDLILESMRIQSDIENLKVEVDGETIGLRDLCFAPLSPDNMNCTIQSISQYYQNNETLAQQSNWLRHLTSCIDSPYYSDCLSVYLAPVFPYVALGGYDDQDYSKAKAMVITGLNNNYANADKINRAKKWESSFLEYMKNLKSDSFNFYYSAERSLEDGVADVSTADIVTIISSYLVIFVYLSIFLASFRSWRTIMVDIRLSMGFACLLMIILSVTSSFGFFSYLGFKTTLIVLEVTPFLILAVGSGDNFIFVKNYVKNFENTNDPVMLKVAFNVRQIGPSLLLSSCAQCVAFGISAIIPVGAVRIFGLYSCFAVVVKFMLQVTFFIAIFYLDSRRQDEERVDILCCIEYNAKAIVEHGNVMIGKIFKDYYCPVLFHRFVKPTILVVFTTWFIVSMVLIPKISIGLEQQAILLDGSYTIDYLTAVEKYSEVGAPVYFVIKDGYNYTDETSQNKVCATVGCSSTSIINQATQATFFPEKTSIAISPTSWLDDYFAWMASDSCCQVFNNTHDLCNILDPADNCVSCPMDPKFFHRRPKPENFNNYLKLFLGQNPNEACPKAGHALFASSVSINTNRPDAPIGATNFMAYHSVARSSSDYIRALEFSRQFADDLSQNIMKNNTVIIFDNTDGVQPVFLYSFVHVFYEQYVSIFKTTLINLILCVIGVFVVALILLGMDIQSSLIVLISLIMTMADVLGAMYIAGIELNAISVVNLVMAVGVAIEFYVHMIRDFSIKTGDNRTERAKSTMEHIGAFIFIGVTVPELISVATMGAAKSKLFRLYFFQMYLILIVTCTLKSMVFLPVFLSYCGPPLDHKRRQVLTEKIDLLDEAARQRHKDIRYKDMQLK